MRSMGKSVRSVRSVCNKDIENCEISGLLENLKHTDLTLTDLCLRLFLIMILRFLMMH